VVGVIEPQGRRVVSYGSLDKGDPRPLNGDTIFEIGSVTKVFTSLVLATWSSAAKFRSRPRGEVSPGRVKVPVRGGPAITLVDLSTHTSGLPRLPNNMHPKIPPIRMRITRWSNSINSSPRIN